MCVYVYIISSIGIISTIFSLFFLEILLPLSIFFLVLFLKFMVLGHQYKC
ncbi:hypothetical protein Hdeb2414_s0026g00677181 [Helianthus debilis subsp. tardiflorus]